MQRVQINHKCTMIINHVDVQHMTVCDSYSLTYRWSHQTEVHYSTSATNRGILSDKRPFGGMWTASTVACMWSIWSTLRNCLPVYNREVIQPSTIPGPANPPGTNKALLLPLRQHPHTITRLSCRDLRQCISRNITRHSHNRSLKH